MRRRGLRIVDLDASDYGDYQCVAANSLGKDQQTMTLFGKLHAPYLISSFSQFRFHKRSTQTKEMIICPSNSNVFSPLRVADVEIERVDVSKLLSVYINRSLKWDERLRSICNKAASRIHFLKQLKRSSLGPDDLFHFYATMIRPVLEYACPVWHSGLTVEHRNRID